MTIRVVGVGGAGVNAVNRMVEAEVEGVRAFARLTPGHWEEGKEHEVASDIVEVFDDFFRALNRISQAV